MKLAKSESLLLARRRAGKNQQQYAKANKVSIIVYGWMEHGLIPIKLNAAMVTAPTVQEVCFIYRRRARLTQAALAEHLGLSRLWINRMEKGKAPITELKKHWGV